MKTPRSNVYSLDKAKKRKANNLILIKWLRQIVKSGEFSPSEIAVCAVLYAHFSNDDFSCWPSRETIAKLMNCDVKTASKYYKSVEKKGFLIIRKLPTPRGFQNYYYMQMPRDHWDNEDDYLRHQQQLFALGALDENTKQGYSLK